MYIKRKYQPFIVWNVLSHKIISGLIWVQILPKLPGDSI